MVRLVFRPYTQVRRSICTLESLRTSTRVSPGFALLRHSSPSFGSQHVCSHSNLSPEGSWSVDSALVKDPLRFWGDDKNSVKFPILRRIALQVLPCQPTSGDVERTATKGTLIVTKHRNRLKGKTVSDLVAAASLCATNVHTTRKKKAAQLNTSTHLCLQ